MAQIISPILKEVGPLFTVNFKSIRLTAEQFEQLCSDNRDLRLELTFEGELIVMPPAGSKTGLRNARLIQRLANWTDADGTGLCFDSSTGFTLPNGAKYSPDSAWIRRDRWDALTNQEQDSFAPLCPDFVIELKSSSDTLSRLRNKMQEYIENGAHLGWLIDPVKRQVHIYRPDHDVEVLDNPETVSGEPLLNGFVLNLPELW
jgi:Uma2 family endonuclease